MSVHVKRRADYLPPDFTISSVSLSIYLHPTKTRVVSDLTVVRKGDKKAPLVLDGEKLNLISVAIDGRVVPSPVIEENSLTLESVPDNFKLHIETEIDPDNNQALEGLYRSNGVYCTQCEAEGFRRITYFLDRPDVLATYRVTLHGDKSTLPTMLANGNLIEQGDNGDGTHWVTWEDPFPKPSYLFAVVAGDFDQLTDTYTTSSGRTVALELYVDKGKRDRGHFALESLKRAMKWDEDTFGLEYDLDVYMIVAVDFFNMGAMENKGLNIFNSKFVLADQQTATDDDFFNVESVIAHEYFHNWTGNRVTCRDWFQLSLKEGLTVFRDQQFSADMTSELSNRIKHVRVMREHQFAEDASAMSHPIRPDEVMEMNNFYTVTVYDKGAEVIRMFHTLLGADGFRKGMDEYFRRHDGQAVTCDDFVDAMQFATDRDLTQFSRWYSQSGTPVLSIHSDFDKNTHTHTFTLSQHTPPTADQKDKSPLVIPVGIEILDSEGNHYTDEEGIIQNNMLVLERESIQFTVKSSASSLTPALLGNFSAPAKVHNSLSPDDYLTIFRFANDDFNRWDALQQLYDWCISQYQEGKAEFVSEAIWQGLHQVIEAEKDNNELLGECLVIPSFETLCQTRTDIEVASLVSAREAFCQDFANKLSSPLLALLESTATGDYRYDQQAVNARRCKNVVLSHLARVEKHDALCDVHFHQADNMTDTLGALKAAQYGNAKQFSSLMEAFENTWKHDPLVLDKWFALHATQPREDILAHISMLKEHPQFSMGNPNRVRALIGSFAFYNSTGFHAADGSGYKFVTDYLLALDKTNPQVAARIVTPLTQWQQFASSHQVQMKQQLSRLLNHKGLSRDLFEKVSKSLAYDKHNAD
ncbi:aminopeptidase N [Alteromonas sp. H39]|uniref:aminopeptidase N n=1 Tax=Alteromonas sp. H39 TaxID=3389876 RepID=UPI0039DF7F08